MIKNNKSNNSNINNTSTNMNSAINTNPVTNASAVSMVQSGFRRRRVRFMIVTALLAVLTLILCFFYALPR